MENAASNILMRDIHQLNISQSLLHLLELNHLNNLQELINYPMEEWFGFTGFSQHLLNEIMNFLESNTLTSLVKD
jgi:DNA-directed RNA polymerase alpha subunit